LVELTRENRAAFTTKTLISLGWRRQRHGPNRALPYALPMLVITKLGEGGLQNFADVALLLGLADDGELAVVRSLAADDGPELAEDIENLIAIGKLEAEMRER
jgi:hypothetical protein